MFFPGAVSSTEESIEGKTFIKVYGELPALNAIRVEL